MARGLNALRVRGRRPPLGLGVLTMVGLVGGCTGLLYPLKQLTSVSALGVVYLLVVVVVSAVWGLWLGLASTAASALAFNFFHLPPVGRFAIAGSRDWVALGAFFVAGVATSSVSELARRRAVEAERRRAEADFTSEMARLLLAQPSVIEALALIGRRLAVVFELPWATIALEEPAADGRRTLLRLGQDSGGAGWLVLPAQLPVAILSRVRERAIPGLTAVLRMALERERLVAEAVQTEALRRSEAVKTAVLRSVSHDLRSPVTAMIAAGDAIGAAPELTRDERHELGAVVVGEGGRLARLIDDLLDLSKLEAHSAAPRLAECSLEEVIEAALAAQPPAAHFEISIDADLPAVHADFVQVERALANLLENATRYSAGQPVRIRARPVGGRAVVRVIDCGPGIADADHERIFEPFYRAAGAGGDGHAGSGLGLAIAKGFVETNGGRLWVESTPGSGSTFVVELPAIVSSA